MLYAFFWVTPRLPNFICRRFGILLFKFIFSKRHCLFHLYRQVGKKYFIRTCLWRWNRKRVPKRRHIKFRRRGITHKKAYIDKSYFANSLPRALEIISAVYILLDHTRLRYRKTNGIHLFCSLSHNRSTASSKASSSQSVI
jgi:hypothetical protein